MWGRKIIGGRITRMIRICISSGGRRRSGINIGVVVVSLSAFPAATVQLGVRAIDSKNTDKYTGDYGLRGFRPFDFGVSLVSTIPATNILIVMIVIILIIIIIIIIAIIILILLY